MHSLVGRLRTVDRSRGPLRKNIAGKFTPKRAFSIGRSKETAYAVSDSLRSENFHSYHRVRLSSVHTDEVIQHAGEGKE